MNGLICQLDTRWILRKKIVSLSVCTKPIHTTSQPVDKKKDQKQHVCKLSSIVWDVHQIKGTDPPAKQLCTSISSSFFYFSPQMCCLVLLQGIFCVSADMGKLRRGHICSLFSFFIRPVELEEILLKVTKSRYQSFFFSPYISFYSPVRWVN